MITLFWALLATCGGRGIVSHGRLIAAMSYSGAKHSTLTAKSQKVGLKQLCVNKNWLFWSTTFAVLTDLKCLHRSLYFNVWRFDPTRSRSCALPKCGKAVEGKFWSWREVLMSLHYMSFLVVAWSVCHLYAFVVLSGERILHYHNFLSIFSQSLKMSFLLITHTHFRVLLLHFWAF